MESLKKDTTPSKSKTTTLLGRHWKVVIAGILGTLMLGAVVILIAQYSWWATVNQRYPDRTMIRAAQNPPSSSRSAGGVKRPSKELRVAIAPVLSPERSYISYKRLIRHIAAKMNRVGKTLTRSTYAEVNALLYKRQCDLALVCTSSFVLAEKESGVSVLAVPVVGGAIHYRSYIVVPKTSPAESLLDLKGKRFASADIQSTSGWIFAAVWLHRRNVNPNTFFSKHLISGSHDRSLLAVAGGEVDGAAVDSIVYDQASAETKGKVRILFESPFYGMPPMVTPYPADSKFYNEMRDVLLGLHKTPQGKALLSDLRIDRFEPAQGSDYDSVRALMRAWDSIR